MWLVIELWVDWWIFIDIKVIQGFHEPIKLPNYDIFKRLELC